MNKPTLNSTVYETSDIDAIFTALAKEFPHYVELENGLLIRYINKVDSRRSYNYETNTYDIVNSYAASKGAGYYSDPLKIAIVRAKLIKLNPLVELARAADAEFSTVPDEVRNDVIKAAIGTHATEVVAKAIKHISKLGLTLRINNKAKDRKLYALRDLRSKLYACQARVKNNDSQIEHAVDRLRYLKECTAQIAENLVDAEKKYNDAVAALDDKKK